MNTADYLLIALLIISTIVGFMRGFLREVVALLAWIIGVLVAWHLGPLLEPHLGGLLAGPQVRPWVARALLLVAFLLLGAAAGALLSHFVRLSIFSGMDRLLGLVFGLLRGLIVLGVLVIFCQTLRLDGERWWHKSLLIPYGESIASALRSLLGEEPRARRAYSVLNTEDR
jgi:membrane protein required for colicin V production